MVRFCSSCYEATGRTLIILYIRNINADLVLCLSNRNLAFTVHNLCWHLSHLLLRPFPPACIVFLFIQLRPLLLSAFPLSLYPLIYLEARPAGFGCFPPSPKRPFFTPRSSSCPSVAQLTESEGGGGLKGRTPDGHWHVGHALCDGAWLRALWTSHSCQS